VVSWQDAQTSTQVKRFENEGYQLQIVSVLSIALWQRTGHTDALSRVIPDGIRNLVDEYDLTRKRTFKGNVELE
jgi:hypothetical protein